MTGCDRVLFPLSELSVRTLHELADVAGENSHIHVCLNAIKNKSHVIEGWRHTCSGKSCFTSIPINQRCFEGITLVEVITSSQKEALSVLIKADEFKKKTGEFVTGLFALHTCSDKNSNKPRLHVHAPDSNIWNQDRSTWIPKLCTEEVGDSVHVGVDGYMKIRNDVKIQLVPDENVVNFRDACAWDPELGEDSFLGIYYQWITESDGRKELKIFLGVKTWCSSLGMDIINLIKRLPLNVTAKDFVESQEIWWWRNVNERNRLRILKMYADSLGLHVMDMKDPNSPGQEYMAVKFNETLFHSLEFKPTDQKVHTLNMCVNTTDVQNGIVCCMAPHEGLWCFHGYKNSFDSKPIFGVGFGDKERVFPVQTIRLFNAMEVDHQATHLKRTITQSVNLRDVLPECCVDIPCMFNVDKTFNDEVCVEDDSEKKFNKMFDDMGDQDVKEVAINAMRRMERIYKSCASQEMEDKSMRRFIYFDEDCIEKICEWTSWKRNFGISKLMPLVVWDANIFSSNHY